MLYIWIQLSKWKTKLLKRRGNIYTENIDAGKESWWFGWNRTICFLGLNIEHSAYADHAVITKHTECIYKYCNRLLWFFMSLLYRICLKMHYKRYNTWYINIFLSFCTVSDNIVVEQNSNWQQKKVTFQETSACYKQSCLK